METDELILMLEETRGWASIPSRGE